MANQYREQRNITDWDQVPVVFDIAMASRILAVNYDKVRQMCRDGIIPAFKIGTNSWRINKEAFMKYLGVIKK